MFNKPTLPRPENIAPCRICGANENEQVWTATNVGRGGGAFLSSITAPLRVFSSATSVKGSDVGALVCKNCGHIEFFANPKDFNT